MNEHKDPATGEWQETIDLVPIMLAFYKMLLDYFMDKPINVQHVDCSLKTLNVCMTHMTDEKINIDLDVKQHYKECKRVLDIGKTSVYNYNEEFKNIPFLDYFCDKEMFFQILNACRTNL